LRNGNKPRDSRDGSSGFVCGIVVGVLYRAVEKNIGVGGGGGEEKLNGYWEQVTKGGCS